jgi:hypothetical protein
MTNAICDMTNIMCDMTDAICDMTNAKINIFAFLEKREHWLVVLLSF